MPTRLGHHAALDIVYLAPFLLACGVAEMIGPPMAPDVLSDLFPGDLGRLGVASQAAESVIWTGECSA
jgi:hypothetical protein